MKGTLLAIALGASLAIAASCGGGDGDEDEPCDDGTRSAAPQTVHTGGSHRNA